MAVVVILALAASAPAQVTRVANTTLTLPQNPQTFGYTTEDAFGGLTFDQPLGIVTAPGETDRIFILEKTGRIQAVTGLGSTPVKQVFLDLSGRVLTNVEEGLLGLAFHPNFATNHYFYVFYSLTATTSAGTGDHERVARFTALPSPATNADILATEVPLISQYDLAPNHNGGDLHFGADGYLYVALGDEGGGNDQYNNSQRIDKDFFSGLLRIDVDQLPGNLTPNAHPSVNPGTYKVPADNPFVGATSFNGSPVNPASVRTEFWAVGLRNPWRFSFDAPTGRLLAGDVGQSAREEIDLITRGGNYGWSYREGTIAGPRSNPPAGASFIDPIWDTPDRSLAAAITGGVVYRGSRFAQLYGQYVFGDYVDNNVFAMTFPATGPVQVTQITTVNSPVGFGVDPSNGDILIASIGTGVIERLIYNSTATGTPLPATLSATGAFTDLGALTPAAGLVDYAPNISFWSDYAIKHRWFSVPAVSDKITFAADGNWTFPAGTIWVKHFDLELTRGDPTTTRRLETRFLVKTAGGVYGVTYRWNTAQTDATLVPEEGADEAITINDGGIIRTQTWHYPGRSECLQCHTPVAGLALSFNTPQLNGSHAYAAGTANQLTALANAGYFTSASLPDPATLTALAPAGDTTATLEFRARSYLAANCVQCHQPGGAAQALWDARIATPTASAGLVDGPLIDSGGDSSNRVIAPGDLLHSMLLTRISARGPGQMPPLASNEVDTADVALVTSWINSFSQLAITTQPLSQAVTVGRPVTFTAAASGSPAPTFQWQKDGANLAGATGSSYTIAAAKAGDAGIYTVVATNSGGSATSGAATLIVLFPSADFNGDGDSDLLWQDTLSGDRLFWLMNGTAPAAGLDLGTLPTEWSIAGIADFNGDGQPDLVWQNLTTGERLIWLMNGTSPMAAVALGTVSTDWIIVGTGDLNGDGKADLLWTNAVTGERTVWLMNGTTPGPTVSLGIVPFQWALAGTGDFNADTQTDLLWENTLTGEISVWLMNGTDHISTTYLGTVSPQWQIAGTGDYNGDGQPDILWTNRFTGERSIWLMNGTTHASTVSVASIPLNWVLFSPVARRVWADFNSDGKSDLVWQNTATGEALLYLMDGTTPFNAVSIGTADPNLQIAATGDFNADGKADLVWQNLATGDRFIWLMDDTAMAASADLGVVSTDWSIVGTGDFNADGYSDLIWKNNVTGAYLIWLMNGIMPFDAVPLGPVDPHLQLVGTGDFNADGGTDLLWQNTVTGERLIWLMSGTAMAASVSLGTIPTAWSLSGTGDFNGDGQTDLIWVNSGTGERVIWLMNGTTPFNGISLGTYPPDWAIKN